MDSNKDVLRLLNAWKPVITLLTMGAFYTGVIWISLTHMRTEMMVIRDEVKNIADTSKLNQLDIVVLKERISSYERDGRVQTPEEKRQLVLDVIKEYERRINK